MARQFGPDESTRKVFRATPDKTIETFGGRNCQLFTDAALTQLADVRAFDPAAPGTPGAVIANSTIKLDVRSEAPGFWFPDGVDVVFGQVHRGPAVRFVASIDFRLDVLEQALLSGGTPQATAGLQGTIQLAGDLTGSAAAPVVKAGAVSTAKLADGAVTAEKIAGGAVAAAHLAPSAVEETGLATGAVTTDKLTDLSVTTGKLALAAVDTTRLADGAVTTGKIADASVTTGKIADGAVGTADIADGAVTDAKLAAIPQSKVTGLPAAIAAATAPATAGGLGQVQLAGDLTGAAAAPVVAAAAIGTTKLADGAVTGVKITDGSVTAAKLGASAVTESRLGAGAVTNTKLGVGAVTDTKILDGAVTTTKLADGAVTDAKLAAVAQAKVTGLVADLTALAADATAGAQGRIRLAGVLGGTAAAPALAAGAVGTAALADGAVTDAKITSLTAAKVTGLADAIATETTATVSATVNAALSAKVVRTVGRTAGVDYLCDGVDDHVQLNQALADVATAGGGTVMIRAGTYSCRAKLTLTASNVALIGEGEGITVIVAAADMDQAQGLVDFGTTAAGTDRSLTVNTALGNRSVTMAPADAATFTVGDRVLLKSNRQIDTEQTSKFAGELHQVIAVDAVGGVVSLNDVVKDIYTTADAAKLTRITMLTDVVVHGITFASLQPQSTISIGFVHFRLCEKLTLSRVEMRDAFVGIQLRSCTNVQMLGCSVSRTRDTVDQTPGTPNNLRYGVWVASASENVVIAACRFIHTRHAVTTGGSGGTNHNGVQRNITVVGCTSMETDTGHYDTHEGSEGVAFVGNTASGGMNYLNKAGAVTGVQIRGRNCIVVGNVITNLPGRGIMVFNAAATNCMIVGNVVANITHSIDDGGVATTNDGTGVYFDQSGSHRHTIVGNTFRNLASRAISASAGNDMVVIGNTFDSAPITGSGVTIYANNCARWLIMGNRFNQTAGRVIQTAGTSTGFMVINNSFIGSGNRTIPVLVGTGNVVKNNMGLATDAMYALGDLTGNVTVTRTNGLTQLGTLTGNVTVTLADATTSPPTGLFAGEQLVLVLTQDATGGRTVTWPATVKLAAGSPFPAANTPANGVDVLHLLWDGTNWRELYRSTSRAVLGAAAYATDAGALQVVDDLLVGGDADVTGELRPAGATRIPELVGHIAGQAGSFVLQGHGGRLQVVDRDSYRTPVRRGPCEPEDYGYAVWTYPQDMAFGGAYAPASGASLIWKFMIPHRMTIAALHMVNANQPAGITGVYTAAYDTAGNLIAGTQSADHSATWNGVTANARAMAFGAPFAVNAGPLFVKWWHTWTAGTAPTLARVSTAVATHNGGLVATPSDPKALRYALGATGLTTVAPATLATFTSTSSVAVFAALSAA